MDINEILADRGKRYGDFTTHAKITQQLKYIARDYYTGDHRSLHVEALDMIFHKIGRILNGDPNYADSWDDIAGYAKLVADRVRT